MLDDDVTQDARVVIVIGAAERRFVVADQAFDLVICTASVEYLTRPIEVFRDVVLRLAPTSADGAAETLAQLRGYPLLQGVRGAPESDIPALVDVIVRMSQLAVEETEPTCDDALVLGPAAKRSERE